MCFQVQGSGFPQSLSVPGSTCLRESAARDHGSGLPQSLRVLGSACSSESAKFVQGSGFPQVLSVLENLGVLNVQCCGCVNLDVLNVQCCACVIICIAMGLSRDFEGSLKPVLKAF